MTDTETQATIAKLMAETAQINTNAVKTLAEIRNLNADTPRLVAETGKLDAERRKLQRETYFYPVIAGGGVVLVAIALVKLMEHLP